MFKIAIETPKLNENSPRQRNADVYCQCCGRGIANRDKAHVAFVVGKDESGLTQIKAPPADWKERDPVEWGSFVGPRCQKLIPSEYKVSMRKAIRYADSWA